jgi:ABC-2 type transport system ATP-binding protein
LTSVLEFVSVSKTFRHGRKEVQALRNVSFDVAEGEVFGFVGPNGAGKTTTIKVMLDVIRAYEGDVRIFGVEAREAAARRGVAYVPESPALYEQFTPLEVLRMGLQMYGIRRPDADAWCMNWLERFSIAHAARRRVRELSKGTVQRVALAHAMVVSPRLLVLDEPLSGLDPVGRKDVVDILFEYKQQGGAIFFTSHVLHDVERLADRFGLIHKGELRAVRAPADLVGEEERVLVRSQGAAAAVPGMTEESSGRWVVELPCAGLWENLRVLEAAGHRLLEVRPTLSLETAFLHVVRESSGAGSPAMSAREATHS